MSQSEQKEKESNKAATEQRAAAETTKDAESTDSAKSQSTEANASDISLKTDAIGLESSTVVESDKPTTHASSGEPPQQAAASDSFAETGARSVETLEIPDDGPIASPPSSTARNESLVATASALQEEVADLKKKLQETRRTHLEEQLQHKRIVDDLKKQVADLKQTAKEKDELYERLLRLSADFDNLRKRSQREREDARKYGHEHLVKELLPMFDNFDLALKSMEEATSPTLVIEGLQLLYKQYTSILHHHGLQRFDAKGANFDYTLHEAISLVETDEFPDGTVCSEFRAGYKLHDRLLRPAMVAVAKTPTKPAEAEPSEPVDDAVGGGGETDAPPAQDIASQSDVPRGTEITDASKEEPEATAEKTDSSSV